MKELSKVTKNERTGHAKYVVWFQNLYSLLLDSGPENPTTVGLQWNLTMDINLKKKTLISKFECFFLPVLSYKLQSGQTIAVCT